MHYALLPYVLSTSFLTHPKPLNKLFQSRRVPLSPKQKMRLSPFFRHCETVQISHFSPIIFLVFCNRRMFKKSQRVPPFTFFGTMRLTGDFKKNSKENSEKIFPQFLVFLRAFVVSSCRKSGSRVLLSLRYGADLGRSRLVPSGLTFQISFF